MVESGLVSRVPARNRNLLVRSLIRIHRLRVSRVVAHRLHLIVRPRHARIRRRRIAVEPRLVVHCLRERISGRFLRQRVFFLALLDISPERKRRVDEEDDDDERRPGAVQAGRQGDVEAESAGYGDERYQEEGQEEVHGAEDARLGKHGGLFVARRAEDFAAGCAPTVGEEADWELGNEENKDEDSDDLMRIGIVARLLTFSFIHFKNKSLCWRYSLPECTGARARSRVLAQQ
jgi:hypothetical protein